MKKLLLLLLPCCFIGCASRFYNYKISMTHPIKSSQLYYENDTFAISLDPQAKTMGFSILNKSTDGIKISWDEVSLSINGQALRVVHKETGVYKINDIQPPTTIPPKSSLEDYLVPTNNVKYLSLSARTYTIVGFMLPVDDFGKKKWDATIRKYKGTKMTIFLPFYIGGKYFSHYYDLSIDDVTLSRSAPKSTPDSKKPVSVGPVKL
jgi:hypothetical protein